MARPRNPGTVLVTAAELKSLMTYDPVTGEFRWHDGLGPSYTCCGQGAGLVRPSGYRVITINHVAYHAARLAHLYMTGEWPPGPMDHVNRDRADDRWVNLRPCTASQNMGNTSVRRANTSGHRGVTFCTRDKAWIVNFRTKHAGYFKKLEDAIARYDSLAKSFYGDFYQPEETGS